MMKQMKTKLTCTVILCVISSLLGTSACRAQIYVSISANGANDGSSWTDAFTDLQPAIAAAISLGTTTEIWVARGEYRPTTTTDRTVSFEMHSNVAMYGGFVGGETLLSERDWVNNRTVLSGDIGVRFTHTDNSYHVVKASGADNSGILDGFIIKHGQADGQNSLYQTGGGLYLDGSVNLASTLIIRNCNFYENFALRGGGIGIDLLMVNSVGPLFYNCLFFGNKARAGSAIRSLSQGHAGQKVTDFRAINCVFVSNISDVGGTIYSTDGSYLLLNSTFTKNQAKDIDLLGHYGAAILLGRGAPVIRNNIIWENYYGYFSNGDLSNPIGEVFTVQPFGSPIIQNNLIQGGYGDTSDNNFDADPLFEREPSFVGVYPRTSVIPTVRTYKYLENLVEFSGSKFGRSNVFYAYMDHTYNKLYVNGYRIQTIDFNNVVEGKPTSRIYNDLWYVGSIMKMEKAISTSQNRIYFGTHSAGIYWIDRATGVSGKIDPLEGNLQNIPQVLEGMF